MRSIVENITSGLTKEKQSIVAVMGKKKQKGDANFHPQWKDMPTQYWKVN